MKIETVSGSVSYNFYATCPHCRTVLDLNSHPYDDDQESYGPVEDELGLALFGTETKPAKWSGLSIQYRCCHCKKYFILSSIEI